MVDKVGVWRVVPSDEVDVPLGLHKAVLPRQFLDRLRLLVPFVRALDVEAKVFLRVEFRSIVVGVSCADALAS